MTALFGLNGRMNLAKRRAFMRMISHEPYAYDQEDLDWLDGIFVGVQDSPANRVEGWNEYRGGDSTLDIKSYNVQVEAKKALKSLKKLLTKCYHPSGHKWLYDDTKLNPTEAWCEHCDSKRPLTAWEKDTIESIVEFRKQRQK